VELENWKSGLEIGVKLETVITRKTSWLLLIAVSFFVPLTDAEIIRTTNWDPAQGLIVDIVWDFPFLPESGVIVEEIIPAGWSVGKVSAEGATPRVLQEGDRLKIAVGMESAFKCAGSLRYILVAETASESGTVEFAGLGKTMQTARVITSPVNGSEIYVIPSTKSAGLLELRAGDFQLNGKTPGQGGRLGFTLIAPVASGSGSILAAQAGPPLVTLYLDYKPALTENTPWQCIQTSAPSDRVDAPDQMVLPEGHRPGFYRMRMKTD
jgi:hypothetical protein